MRDSLSLELGKEVEEVEVRKGRREWELMERGGSSSEPRWRLGRSRSCGAALMEFEEEERESTPPGSEFVGELRRSSRPEDIRRRLFSLSCGVDDTEDASPSVACTLAVDQSSPPSGVEMEYNALVRVLSLSPLLSIPSCLFPLSLSHALFSSCVSHLLFLSFSLTSSIFIDLPFSLSSFLFFFYLSLPFSPPPLSLSPFFFFFSLSHSLPHYSIPLCSSLSPPLCSSLSPPLCSSLSLPPSSPSVPLPFPLSPLSLPPLFPSVPLPPLFPSSPLSLSPFSSPLPLCPSPLSLSLSSPLSRGDGGGR